MENSINIQLYLPFILPLIVFFIFLIVVIIANIDFGIIKLLPLLWDKKIYSNVDIRTISLKNENVLIEYYFSMGNKKIHCYNLKDIEQQIWTKAESSRYFAQKRLDCFSFLCENFDDEIDYEKVSETLKKHFNIIENKFKTKEKTAKKSLAKRTVKNKKDERIIDF